MLISSARALAENTQQLEINPIKGIHLEGPFISPEDGARGAHPRAYVCPPDKNLFSQIQEAAAGMIKMLTLSPEWPDAPEFINVVCRSRGKGCNRTYFASPSAQIRDAVAAGANFSHSFGQWSSPDAAPASQLYLGTMACDELAARV